MKCKIEKENISLGTSPSTRRVWIEINFFNLLPKSFKTSPSTRRVWIEIGYNADATYDFCAGHPPHGGCGLKYNEKFVKRFFEKSPSTRRVWIEIAMLTGVASAFDVTLHTEGVD